MRKDAVRVLAVAFPVLLAFAAAGAADPKPADPAAEESVKVYTNADLERMFGPPTPSEPRNVDPDAAARDQKLIESFLEREHRQIQAEQDLALKRQAMEQQAAPAEESYTMGYAPYAGWWGEGWQGGYGGGNRGHSKPTPYFSPYAPKPGQPGWNELILSHPWKSPVNPGHGPPPKPQPRKGGR